MPLADDVGFLLSRASGLTVRATNAALLAHGLRVRQYAVLALTADAKDGVSQRDLAEELGLDPSQVVLLVDELTASGLVERRPSPTDRRAKLVGATANGRRVRTRAEASAGAAIAAQLDVLTVAEQGALKDLLQRLVAGRSPGDKGAAADRASVLG
jgi:DNA-binding MarR family transcriptional regulator